MKYLEFVVSWSAVHSNSLTSNGKNHFIGVMQPMSKLEYRIEISF